MQNNNVVLVLRYPLKACILPMGVIYPRLGTTAVAHYRFGVCTWPSLRGAKEFNRISNFLYAWFIHIAHTFFFLLLHKSNTDETRTPKICTKNYCSWSLIIQELWIIEENEDLWMASDIWSDRIKKLDEDANRIKNRYKLFLSKASKSWHNGWPGVG